MTPTLYIYRTRSQPLTRYTDDHAPHGVKRHINAGGKLFWAFCCGKRRPAKNLRIQVYYDAFNIFCAPGKGCKATK